MVAAPKPVAKFVTPSAPRAKREIKLKPKEDVETGGVEAFVPTLNKLFAGENFGKLVLKV